MKTPAQQLRLAALRSEREKWERTFRWHWDRLRTGLHLREQERIVPGRQFRFDFVHVQSMVAVELDGGTQARGGHSTGLGIERGYAKANEAARLGWCVLRYGTKRMEADMAGIVEEVLEVIRARGGSQ